MTGRGVGTGLGLALTLFIAAVIPARPAPQTPEIASMTGEQAQQMVRRLSPLVEDLRGLKFRDGVPVRVVNDATTRDHMKSRIARFWPEEQRRAEQIAWTQIGLLPRGTRFVGSLLSVLEEQAGGFYDPDRDTFFLLEDMPRAVAPLLMVHELTHALDDQHFGIDTLLEQAREDNDRTLALGAVVEGSGTVVMTAYLLQEIDAGGLDTSVLMEFQQTEAGRAEKLRAAPQVLQRTLLAPYFLGQTFLLRGKPGALADHISGADLDRAFRDPPESTEQVLHPEKYWDEGKRDRPRAVAVADLAATLGEGWSLTAHGTMGELYLAILTGGQSIDVNAAANARPGAWTNEAAAGWGGDRWYLYEKGDRSVTLFATLWDTGKDAREFEAALEPADELWVQRRADAVVLVAGDEDSRLADMGREALAALVNP